LQRRMTMRLRGIRTSPLEYICSWWSARLFLATRAKILSTYTTLSTFGLADGLWACVGSNCTHTLYKGLSTTTTPREITVSSYMTPL
jgi:hypothetical protein